MKLTGAGVAGMSLVRLGFDVKPVQAYAAGLKIEGAKEVISICHFCSCGCNVLMHVQDGKLINVEGDPDYPVSEGSLCAKGAAMLSMHNNDKRLLKPMYRAPGSDKWEEMVAGRQPGSLCAVFVRQGERERRPGVSGPRQG